MTTDRRGRKRSPAQDAAIAALRNPEGIVSRSHNIATDEESHNWFAAQGSRVRGAIVARARKRQEAPRRPRDRTRLYARGVSPETQEWAKERARGLGLGMGEYLSRLIDADRYFGVAVEIPRIGRRS